MKTSSSSLILQLFVRFHQEVLIELNKKAGEPRKGWLNMGWGLCTNLKSWLIFHGLEEYNNPLTDLQSQYFNGRIFPFSRAREFQSECVHRMIFANPKRLEFIQKMAKLPN